MPPLIYQSNVGISLRHAVGRGGILRAADATALAQTLGLPEAALEATLQQWITQHPDSLDAFGRSAPAKPLTPPYYAARITGAQTQGGLVVDAAGLGKAFCSAASTD